MSVDKCTQEKRKKTDREPRDVENHKVQSHAQRDGTTEIQVGPQG